MSKPPEIELDAPAAASSPAEIAQLLPQPPAGAAGRRRPPARAAPRRAPARGRPPPPCPTAGFLGLRGEPPGVGGAFGRRAGARGHPGGDPPRRTVEGMARFVGRATAE